MISYQSFSKLDYECLFETMPDAFTYNQIILDNNGYPIDFIVLQANNAFRQLSGLSIEEIVGKKLSNIFPELELHKHSPIEIAGRIAVEGGHVIFDYYSIPFNKWFSMCIYSNQPLFFTIIIRDITIKKFEHEKLRTLLNFSPDYLIATDMKGKITDCNYKVLEALGKQSKSEIVGSSALNLISPKYRESFREDIVEIKKHGCLNNRRYELFDKNGYSFYSEISINVIYDSNNNPVNYIGIAKDISYNIIAENAIEGSTEQLQSIINDKKRTENEIRFLSYHDKLTELYNRVYFEQELNRLDNYRQLPISLIIVDLNGLKLTNDILGHNEGDRLLKELSQILKKCCRKEDIIARWGGDEFAIVLPKTPNPTAMMICERIMHACSEAALNPLLPSISLGCATKKDASQSIQHIIQEAENRMYRHKLLDSKSLHNSLITSLEKTLLERNYETEEHAQRMKKLSIKLGKALGLSKSELDELSLLSLLHDIGKIAVPDSILMKPGKLTATEWCEMQKHTEIGFRIAKSSKQLSHIADYILSHHEKWDGTGYPNKLKGKQIPKLSRILTVIDAYDVMTNTRPYKEAITHTEALVEIKRCTGSQFDPEISNAFTNLMSKVKK